MNHKTACRNYLNNFYEENGYVFCELCNRSNNPPYSTHHIYSAGQHPKHEQLHNPLNLILLCYTCHTGFHQKPSEFREAFTSLEEERGLKDLFKKRGNGVLRDKF